MKNINKIKWDDNSDDDGTHDLCGTDRFKKFVDVTHSYLGTWSVLYNNIRLKDDFTNRLEAKNWSESTDLVNALSEYRY